MTRGGEEARHDHARGHAHEGAPAQEDAPGADACRTHDGLRYFAPGAEPAVFAAGADVRLAPPATSGRLSATLDDFLAALVERLAAAGCVMVGHIKGALEAAQGRCSFSVTSGDEAPRWTGAMAGPVSELRLTLNVIVFGVSEATVRDAVLACWPAQEGLIATWR